MSKYTLDRHHTYRPHAHRSRSRSRVVRGNNQLNLYIAIAALVGAGVLVYMLVADVPVTTILDRLTTSH